MIGCIKKITTAKKTKTLGFPSIGEICLKFKYQNAMIICLNLTLKTLLILIDLYPIGNIFIANNV